MFCPQCGVHNPDGVAFCGSCGSSMKDPFAPEKPANPKETWWRKLITSPLMLCCAIGLSLIALNNVINLLDTLTYLSYFTGDIYGMFQILVTLAQPVCFALLSLGMWLLYVEGRRSNGSMINTTAYTILLAGAGVGAAVGFISLIVTLMSVSYYGYAYDAGYIFGMAAGNCLTLAMHIFGAILLVKCKQDVYTDLHPDLTKVTAGLFFAEGGLATMAMFFRNYYGLTALATLMVLVGAATYFMLGALVLKARKNGEC